MQTVRNVVQRFIFMILSDNWYCSAECEHQEEADDAVLHYSKDVLFKGLNLLARRDAVRENDGPAMISHWKHDMIAFANNNHYKYMILAHRFLAGMCTVLNMIIIVFNRLLTLESGQMGTVECTHRPLTEGISYLLNTLTCFII